MRPALVLAAIALVVALVYAVSCAWWPFRDCMVCDGRGAHRPSGNRRISRPCRWCRGAGKRLRLGRRAWNRLQRTRNAAG